jgi:hypothetical protein
MKLNGRRVDLPTLRAEIIAAGIAIGDLGTAGDELVTWDADGHTVPDLPAAVTAVLAAHVVPPPPPQPDFGSEVPDNAAYLLADRVAQLRTFLDTPNASITPAMTIGAIKLTIRVVLWLVRRSV